jgi:hypothetical protein
MVATSQKQLYFEDVTVGDEVTPLSKGPMSPMHLMRWSASIENWHRIHYDEVFTKEHDKLPERLVNGSWKQHVMVQMMKDWVGPEGWLWKISFQFRGMDIVWDHGLGPRHTHLRAGWARLRRVRDRHAQPARRGGYARHRRRRAAAAWRPRRTVSVRAAGLGLRR